MENKSRAEIFDWTKSLTPLQSIFDSVTRCNLLIGMPLHSIILAIRCEVPFLSIVYSGKVRNFLESTALHNLILKSLSPVSVLTHAQRVLNQGTDIEMALRKQRKILESKVALNIEVLRLATMN